MTPFIRPGEQVFRACSPLRRLPSGVVSADVAKCPVQAGLEPTWVTRQSPPARGVGERVSSVPWSCLFMQD